MLPRAVLFAAAPSVTALPVLAHPARPGHVGSLLDGLAHPISGFDHILAMVAVGLWAAFLGDRAVCRGVGIALGLAFSGRRLVLARGLGGVMASIGLVLLGSFA